MYDDMFTAAVSALKIIFSSDVVQTSSTSLLNQILDTIPSFKSTDIVSNDYLPSINQRIDSIGKNIKSPLYTGEKSLEAISNINPASFFDIIVNPMRLDTYPMLSRIGETTRNINPIYFDYAETMRVLHNIPNDEFIRVNSTVNNFSGLLRHALNSLSIDPNSFQGGGFMNFLEAEGFGLDFLYERLGHHAPI